MTGAAIAEANNLEPKAALQAGEKLIIPAAVAASEQGKLTRYRVRRGDTVNSIAEQFSVTLAELRQWNNLRSDRITRGVTLRVYPGGRPPATERASAKRPSKAAPSSEVAQQAAALPASPAMGRFHRVRAGETLWSIARAYQTTVEALRSANQFLISRQLQVGDQLLIASAPR